MSELKVTPGEWVAVPYVTSSAFTVRADRVDVCEVMTMRAGERASAEERRANALLIAASPNLYRALVRARAALADCHGLDFEAPHEANNDTLRLDHSLELAAIDAAIAKALGTSVSPESATEPTN